MSSVNPLDDLIPSGAAIMFNPLASIQRSAFPLIIFLSKLEWKRLGNCPASYLKISGAEVIGV